MPYITEEQRLENRHRLLRSTYRLFIREGEKMTTQMVCTDAGVGKGTLFTYFESKELLLHSAYIEADENACRLTWRNLDLTGTKRDIVRQLIFNAMEWPLSFPDEVVFSARYNDMAHNNMYDPGFSMAVKSALDAPGVPERLLEGIHYEIIRQYARYAASSQFFSFMEYLVDHPAAAKDTTLVNYVIDKITAFFE